ncbi:hypothetical protein [Nocardia terpenica]|uniref:hypothetical protein n=1 Tax=Nocardia terpenica TaxID=455432 RepID=UPI0012FE72F6|nr:hypothetical protein [Nocardia terpenica]
MTAGTLVYWIGETGVDTTVGKILAYPAIDPDDGTPDDGFAEVRWADGEFDICRLSEIAPVPDPTPEQFAAVAAF